jgi:hypothetical protein
VAAYRLIGVLRGDSLCYIIIKVRWEIVQVQVQQAIRDVGHWRGCRVWSACEVDGTH